jgi:hypothetical protein
VIGKLMREPIPVATFKLANTHSFAGNGSVEISIRKGEQRVTCTVADVQPDSVKVVCPVDPELTEGTEVALLPPGAATAAPPEPPPMPSGGSGSAAGEPAGGASQPPAAAPGEPAGGANPAAAAPGEPAGGTNPAPASGSAAPAAGSAEKSSN